jgi:hypothetical protein
MSRTVTATSGVDQVAAFHFSQYVFVDRSSFGPVTTGIITDSNADAAEPYNGIVEGFNSSSQALSLFNQLSGEMLAIALSFPPENIPFVHTVVTNYFELFDDTAVDYSSSNLKVFVDLEASVQHGGFAEGDVLTDVFEVTGSPFDDVIRGSKCQRLSPRQQSTTRQWHGSRWEFIVLHPSQSRQQRSQRRRRR